MRLDEIKGRIREISFELNKRRSKNELIHFIRKIKESIGHKYFVNWHHDEIARHLERTLRDDPVRMMIWVPPQYGKSELVSRALPAWLLGHNPRLKIILASYAAELAEGFNRDVQKIIESGTYNDIFPDTVFTRTTARESQTSKGGYLYAIGVGGALAGRGADLFIIDDPHSEQEAKTGRPDVFLPAWEWFQSGPLQRLMPGGAIIVVMTRWSKLDLTGMIVNQMERNEDVDPWEVVEFPAIKDDGEALWPEFWDVNELLAKKAAIDIRYWNAQYMQKPTSEEGALIKREWWKIWDKDTPPQCEFTIMSLDAAQEANTRADYNALTK